MKFAGALDPEDADVGPLANDPPEMKPLALALEIGGAPMLQRAKPFDLFGINSVRGSHGDEDVEQQLYLLASEGWNAPRLVSAA